MVKVKVKREPRFVTRKVVASAQIGLSLMFSIGYFVTLWEFIHGGLKVDPNFHDAIQGLLSLLTAGELVILNFWFLRSRPEDPARNEHPNDPH